MDTPRNDERPDAMGSGNEQRNDASSSLAGNAQKGMSSHACATCGQQHVSGEGAGLDKLLKNVGLSDTAISAMHESLENVDLESYFNQAREYLKDSSTKARDFAKENKGTIAAAAAVVAAGAGLLIAINRKGE